MYKYILLVLPFVYPSFCASSIEENYSYLFDLSNNDLSIDSAPSLLNIEKVLETQEKERKAGNGEHITTQIVLLMKLKDSIKIERNKKEPDEHLMSAFLETKRQVCDLIKNELKLNANDIDAIPSYNSYKRYSIMGFNCNMRENSRRVLLQLDRGLEEYPLSSRKKNSSKMRRLKNKLRRIIRI